LFVFIRQKSKFKRLLISDHVFTWKGSGPEGPASRPRGRFASSGPLVGGLEADPRAHGSGERDRGNTHRRLEGPRAVVRHRWNLRESPGSTRSSFGRRCVDAVGSSFLPVFAWHGRSGGDEETRTPDPLLAKEMLFRLSYVPSTCQASNERMVWWAFLDSNQRPLPYQGSALTS
jgi:hypothetical protein